MRIQRKTLCDLKIESVIKERKEKHKSRKEIKSGLPEILQLLKLLERIEKHGSSSYSRLRITIMLFNPSTQTIYYLDCLRMVLRFSFSTVTLIASLAISERYGSIFSFWRSAYL
jgi:hypothetical protein